MNDNKTYPNTQTFLIEASRSDSIIDNKDNNDYNSKWSTETQFQLKRGDTVSVEMVALNAQNAGSSQTIEFTGDRVTVDGKQKSYCDNKVLVEVFFYLNNNNTYSVGMPLCHPAGAMTSGTHAENKQTPVVYGDTTNGTNNRGFTYTPGSVSFLNAGVIGTPPNAYVGQVIDANTCHFIIAMKDVTGNYVTSVGAGVDEIVGFVLGKSGDTNPKSGQPTDYASWFGGQSGANKLCNVYNGMMWGVEDLGGNLEINAIKIESVIEQTANLTSIGYAGTGRVEIVLESRTEMSGLDTVSQGDLWGLNWETEKLGSSEIGLVNYDNLNQSCWKNFPSYVAKNRGLGYYMNNIGFSDNTMSTEYNLFNGPYYTTSANSNLTNVAKADISDPASEQGFRNAQVRHDNNGKPYIFTRNDWCGQGRRSARSGEFLPKLEPLSAFILLEADELFTDVNALAQKLNDKLHETLNIFDTEVKEHDNFLTNQELYPNLNTKTSSILPVTQTNGYVDPTVSGTDLDARYAARWDSIIPVKFGGTCKIQPANFDDGINWLYQKGYMEVDETSDDYIKSTYVKKCPNPNINIDAIENPIYGNCGYLNFYKAQLGDRWQRISLQYLNTVNSRKPAPAFGERNCGKPVILNEKLLYKNVTLTLPSGTATIKTTSFEKNQLLFTNLNFPEKDSDGNYTIQGIDQQYRDLAKEIKKYEIYNNKVNGSNNYEKQERTLDWVFDFDIGITNDNATSFLREDSGAAAATTDTFQPMTMPWTDEYPATADPTVDTTYGSGCDGSTRELICPSTTTAAFGYHHTQFYWQFGFQAYRGLGNVYIESRFDPNYFDTSLDMAKITADAVTDVNCQLIDADKYKKSNFVYPDIELMKELNIGCYPYLHTDEDGVTQVLTAIRVGETYEAFDNEPLSIQIGCVTWGNTIGVSPSASDNHMIVPMNADFKSLDTTFPISAGSGTYNLNRSLRANRQNLIWMGANNPTFQFNADKNRYEFINLQTDQLLSSLNTAQGLGNGVSSQLGDKVGIVNSITVDSVFSNILGKSSINKGVRSEVAGVGIYKVWLCPPDYNPPPDINLVNYWDNSTLTKTQENHDAITARCIEATPKEWEGCLLDRCGFDYYSLFPKYGYQFNRFDPNTFNSEDPKIIGQGVKPLILNNSVDNVTNPSLSLYYDPTITPPASAIPSGVPNFGLGVNNNQAVLLSVQSLPLTATNSPILTTSPFYIIYSDIVGERNYQSGSTPLPAVFYCMRNYSNSGFFYGYGSTFQIMINQDRHLSLINTEIRNPNGELAKLSKNSTIMYKIQRQAIIPPPMVDVFGQLENQQSPDPNQDELMQILQNTNNIANSMASGTKEPKKGGHKIIDGGGGIGTRQNGIVQRVNGINNATQTVQVNSRGQGVGDNPVLGSGISTASQAEPQTSDMETATEIIRLASQGNQTTQEQLDKAVEAIANMENVDTQTDNVIGTDVGTETRTLVNTDVAETQTMIDQEELGVQTDDVLTQESGFSPDDSDLQKFGIGQSDIDRKIVETIIRGIMGKVTQNWRINKLPEAGITPDYFPITLKKGDKITDYIARAIRSVFTNINVDALLQLSGNNPDTLVDLLAAPADPQSGRPAGLLAGLNINSEGRVTFNPNEQNPKLGKFQLEASPMNRNPELQQIVDMILKDNLNRYDRVGKRTYTNLRKKLSRMNRAGNLVGILKLTDPNNAGTYVYQNVNPSTPSQGNWRWDDPETDMGINDRQSVPQTIDQLNEMDFLYISQKGLTPDDALSYYQMLGDEIKPEERLTRAEAEVRRMQLAERKGKLPEYQEQMLQKQLAKGGGKPPATDGSGGGQPPPQSQPPTEGKDMDI